MFNDVIGEYGHVDFLVDNAGIQFAADSEALPVDRSKVLAVNLRGAFLCAQQALGILVEAGAARCAIVRCERPPGDPQPRFLPYSCEHRAAM